jgi:hypothetical protein
MSDRELATVLYSLRCFQEMREADANSKEDETGIIDACGFFAEHEPLTDEEIDALCEKLNAPAAPANELVQNLRAWAEKFQKDNYFAYSGLITLAHKFEKAFESK